KDDPGEYPPRHLDLSLKELIALRSQAIAVALRSFAPDVLIVDKVPRGAVHELDRALQALWSSGRTRCVLGLRDVLDDPATVRREWLAAGNHGAVRRYYDAIWVYGDRAVFDAAAEYDFPPARYASPRTIAPRVRYRASRDRRRRTRPAGSNGVDKVGGLLTRVPGRLVLCTVGGGQDGGPLAEAFARADFPPDVTGVILTG